MGGGPGARQPGRHRHAGHRRRDRHGDARLRQRSAELVGHAARLSPRRRPRRCRRDRRDPARAPPRRAGRDRDARCDDERHGRGRPGLPPGRAHRALAFRRRGRALGRALLGVPPLLVLLAPERGLGRALRPGDAGRQPHDGHLLRQGLRRGRRRARRRRNAQPPRGPRLPHLPGRVRAQLPRARVLRAARARRARQSRRCAS